LALAAPIAPTGRDDGWVTSRLFVALWPVDAARQALATTLQTARGAALDVRWQPADRWHVTLAFLGPADPDRSAGRIAAAMERDPPPPEPIRLRGAGSFGPVIWIGVEHGAWLDQLAGDLQRALKVADRRFRGHVTVGRIRGPNGPARAREVAPHLAAHSGPPWTPTDITLVESQTGPTPSYTVRRSWPLS
jgi:2'-5' RNA ligase